jgi:hypothetical protein
VITLPEACFGPESRPNGARILKRFNDGYRRIGAIIKRGLLAHPATKVELTSVDSVRSEATRANETHCRLSLSP